MPKRKIGDRHEAETDLQTCPICLEAIAKRAAVHVSRCQPVPHIMHTRCWKRQTDRQQDQCCVCRQIAVDDLTFIAAAEVCGVEHKRAKVGDLTPCGKGVLESLQRGVISRQKLWSVRLWMRHDGERPSDDVMGRLCSSSRRRAC